MHLQGWVQFLEFSEAKHAILLPYDRTSINDSKAISEIFKAHNFNSEVVNFKLMPKDSLFAVKVIYTKEMGPLKVLERALDSRLVANNTRLVRSAERAQKVFEKSQVVGEKENINPNPWYGASIAAVIDVMNDRSDAFSFLTDGLILKNSPELKFLKTKFPHLQEEKVKILFENINALKLSHDVETREAYVSEVMIQMDKKFKPLDSRQSQKEEYFNSICFVFGTTKTGYLFRTSASLIAKKVNERFSDLKPIPSSMGQCVLRRGSPVPVDSFGEG